MKKIKYIIALFAAFSLASCTDIIELDIPEGEKLIIINGRVTDSIPVYAQILESAPIFSEDLNPAIQNAIVLLFEDDINVATLTQDTTGFYRADFIGSINKTYRLEVTVPVDHPELGNTTWASRDELLKPVAKLDSIYQEALADNPPFVDAGEYLFYDFTETAGLGDRLRIRYWKNDTLQGGGSSIIAFDDEFIDGRTFTNNPNIPNALPALQVNGSPGKDDEKWKVEHSSITKDYMKYLELVNQQTAQTGGLFDPPPALLEGNIYGVTNQSKTALGYFAASALQTLEATIKL
jgi:hypothetical protein